MPARISAPKTRRATPLIIFRLSKTISSVNAKSTNEPSARILRAGIFGMLLATGLPVDKAFGVEPSVIASQAPTTPLTTEWQQEQPDEMSVFTPAGEAPGSTLPEMLLYGPVQLRPHLDYRFLYGNGIEAGLDNQQSTAINEISPGFRLDLGSHWVVDYTPTIRVYSNDQFHNTVDNVVSLTGSTRYDDWMLGITHTSALTSAPLIETGNQTDQQSHSTALTASRQFSSTLSADFGLSQQINLVSGLQDSYTWSTLDWLNYQFWPRLTAGIGAGGGYVKVDSNGPTRGLGNPNLDQSFEQLQARINWRATDKISFQVSGGLDDRQFMTAGSGDSLNPIFSASVQYQPFKQTQISLSANRIVSSSDYYVVAQETTATGVSLNLDQRFLKKFHLGVSVGYATTDYSTPSGQAAAGRNDDTLSFSARLSHPFFKRGTWSVFYQYNDNLSTQNGYGFESNQVGFEVSYAY